MPLYHSAVSDARTHAQCRLKVNPIHRYGTTKLIVYFECTRNLLLCAAIRFILVHFVSLVSVCFVLLWSDSQDSLWIVGIEIST